MFGYKIELFEFWTNKNKVFRHERRASKRVWLGMHTTYFDARWELILG